jgi:hypothetical protein
MGVVVVWRHGLCAVWRRGLLLSVEGAAMTERERVRLLHGPYLAPPLKRGDRATCLLRDGDVIIASVSAGRIPLPRCRALGKRGGSGLLLAGDLDRAVRCESAAALCYWLGVTEGVVWRWRLAVGVARHGTEGSCWLRNCLNAKLRAAACLHGGDAGRLR